MLPKAIPPGKKDGRLWFAKIRKSGMEDVQENLCLSIGAEEETGQDMVGLSTPHTELFPPRRGPRLASSAAWCGERVLRLWGGDL